MSKGLQSVSDYATNSPEDFVVAAESGQEPRHQSSLTDYAADLVQRGTPPESNIRDEIPGEAVLRAGDPDVALLESEYSGEEVPGGSMPTPDQNNIDDIGRAYGFTDADSGALISAEELRARRDLHRWELDPRSKDIEN